MFVCVCACVCVCVCSHFDVPVFFFRAFVFCIFYVCIVYFCARACLFVRQSLLMSRLVNEKFIVTYVESGKSSNKQASAVCVCICARTRACWLVHKDNHNHTKNQENLCCARTHCVVQGIRIETHQIVFLLSQ